MYFMNWKNMQFIIYAYIFPVRSLKKINVRSLKKINAQLYIFSKDLLQSLISIVLSFRKWVLLTVLPIKSYACPLVYNDIFWLKRFAYFSDAGCNFFLRHYVSTFPNDCWFGTQNWDWVHINQSVRQFENVMYENESKCDKPKYNKHHCISCAFDFFRLHFLFLLNARN